MPWLAPTLDGSSMWAPPGGALDRMLRAQDWVEVAGPQGPTIPPPVPAPPALVRTINGKTANASGALALTAGDLGAIDQAELDALTTGVGRLSDVSLRATYGSGEPVPFATKASPQFDSGVALSDGTIMGGTARLSHVAQCSVFGVRLAFTNWYSGPANIETDGPNDITVRASIEPVAAATIPITFGGKKSVTIEPGCTVWSDPVGVDIAKGVTFFTRTFVSVASGQKFPRCGHYVSGAQEGQNYANPAGADTTTSATTLSGVGLNVRVYGPAAILGWPSEHGRPVIGIVGDSIANGSGDNDIGYPQRSLGGDYAFQKVGHPGEPLAGWVGQSGKVRARRAALLAAAGITHAIFEYGVNSLSVSTLQADLVTGWRTLWRGGVKVYQTTLTPQTTSTDAWATIGNQALLKTTAEETRRLDCNAWLRDGAPIDAADVPQPVGTVGAGILRAGQAGHPLAGWIEIADLAESARNSGKWKPDYTSDGTHPNPTGAAALAAAIAPATLFGPASAT